MKLFSFFRKPKIAEEDRFNRRIILENEPFEYKRFQTGKPRFGYDKNFPNNELLKVERFPDEHYEGEVKAIYAYNVEINITGYRKFDTNVWRFPKRKYAIIIPESILWYYFENPDRLKLGPYFKYLKNLRFYSTTKENIYWTNPDGKETSVICEFYTTELRAKLLINYMCSQFFHFKEINLL